MAAPNISGNRPTSPTPSLLYRASTAAKGPLKAIFSAVSKFGRDLFISATRHWTITAGMAGVGFATISALSSMKLAATVVLPLLLLLFYALFQVISRSLKAISPPWEGASGRMTPEEFYTARPPPFAPGYDGRRANGPSAPPVEGLPPSPPTYEEAMASGQPPTAPVDFTTWKQLIFKALKEIATGLWGFFKTCCFIFLRDIVPALIMANRERRAASVTRRRSSPQSFLRHQRSQAYSRTLPNTVRTAVQETVSTTLPESVQQARGSGRRPPDNGLPESVQLARSRDGGNTNDNLPDSLRNASRRT